MAFFKNNKSSKDKSDNNSQESLDSIFLDDINNDDSVAEMGELLNDDDFGGETTNHNLNYEEFDNVDGEGYVNNSDNLEKEEQVKAKKKQKMIMMIGIPIVIIVFIGGILFSSSGGDNKQKSDTEQSQPSEQNDSSNKGVTVNEQINKAYVGNEDGNPKANGTGAILAFDYDYYVNRSGEEAIKHFNPEVKAYTASTIQSGIDKVSQGTKYELSITPKVIGEEYDVKLKLDVPGYSQIVYNQKFSIMEKDGEFFVKSFNLTSSSEDEESTS